VSTGLFVEEAVKKILNPAGLAARHFYSKGLLSLLWHL
jgi:hypothetical protein